MEPHGQSPWSLHKLPAFAHKRWTALTNPRKGYGEVSASGGIPP